MVIGRGLMAKGFHGNFSGDNGTIIFASGVSHSKETDEFQFQRERGLLQDTLVKYPGKLLVYFSSCSIYDPSLSSSRYVAHKLEMEELIKKNSSSYLIFRVSNVVGNSKNNATIFNYLVNHILTNTHFNLWNKAERNLIDVEDTFRLGHYIISKTNWRNQIINIANPYNFLVTDLVAKIEAHFNKKAKFDLIERGESFSIDTQVTEEVANQLGIDFSNGYVENLLRKYYKTTYDLVP